MPKTEGEDIINKLVFREHPDIVTEWRSIQMKKTLLLLVLALSLVLSGCALVVKDPVVDARQVILDINGQTIDKQTFVASYNTLLNNELQMQQLYQMYGLQAPAIDYPALQNSAKDDVIRQELIRQNAVALGLDQLTQDEQDKLKEDVDNSYAETLEQLKEYYLSDTKLEGEELDHELEHLAEETGNTIDRIESKLKADLISDKLRAETVKDAVVGDEEVLEEYDAKVSDDKAAYDEDPDSYGEDVNGGQTPYYAPEGYRYIKQVLVKFLEDDQAEIDRIQGEKSTADTELQTAKDAKTAHDEAMSAEDITEDEKKTLEEKTPELADAVLNAQEKADKLARELLTARNKGYENILAKAQDIYNKAVAEGGDFDALAAEFNQDAGMPATGYAVREGFASFDEAFVKPAMALAAIGDVAEPSQGIYGYYIVQYAGDIPSGPISYDSVKEAIHGELLTAKQNEVWEAAITGWKEAADIKEHMDRLEN